MFVSTVYSEEHEAFRETVRKYIEEHITPYHDQWEKDGIVSRDAWIAAGEYGLLCAEVGEEYGGAGVDFLFSAVLIEELARANANGPGFYLHSDIVTPYFVRYASEELKSKWLPRMVKGEVITAIAMTEPGAGSDLQNIKATARREGDEYVINGQKVFISNGQISDLILVACKTDPEAGGRGISLILVEADRPGFSRGRNLEKIGWKAQDTSELFFEDVRVPVTNLVGAEGNGFVQMVQQLPQERLLQAIRAVALMEAALEWTVDYTKERRAFGRTVSGFQNTRFKLAEVKANAVMLRAFLNQCLLKHCKGGLTATEGAMIKMLSTEMLGKALDECLQLHGGYGYMWEYPIARAWADARMGRIAGGTGEIMREIIGRELLGR